jgi:hypothetical protein
MNMAHNHKHPFTHYIYTQIDARENGHSMDMANRSGHGPLRCEPFADQCDVAAVGLSPGAPAGAAPLIIEALADLGTIREVSDGYPLSA